MGLLRFDCRNETECKKIITVMDPVCIDNDNKDRENDADRAKI